MFVRNIHCNITKASPLYRVNWLVFIIQARLLVKSRNSNFKHVRINCIKRPLASSCLSAPLPTSMHQRDSYCTDFRNIWAFQENLFTKFNFFFFKLRKISGTPSGKIILLTSVRNVHFAARQQCKGNPLLLFHGNTERLYIVDSYMYFSKNTEGKHFCVYIEAKIVTFDIPCLSCCVQYLWHKIRVANV